MAETSRCLRCGTEFTRYEDHFVEEAASFDDGCVWANNRCLVSGVWWWDRGREDDNPHGHEFPSHWVRKDRPDLALR